MDHQMHWLRPQSRLCRGANKQMWIGREKLGVDKHRWVLSQRASGIFGHGSIFWDATEPSPWATVCSYHSISGASPIPMDRTVKAWRVQLRTSRHPKFQCWIWSDTLVRVEGLIVLSTGASHAAKTQYWNLGAGGQTLYDRVWSFRPSTVCTHFQNAGVAVRHAGFEKAWLTAAFLSRALQ